MARLTKAQRNIHYKDETINELWTDVHEDSKAQAKKVARLYKDGKFRNWLTDKNLLSRMIVSSKTISANTRKKVDENKQDWERYRTKNEERIEKEKDRERVAISKITTKFKNYKFSSRRK